MLNCAYISLCQALLLNLPFLLLFFPLLLFSPFLLSLLENWWELWALTLRDHGHNVCVIMWSLVPTSWNWLYSSDITMPFWLVGWERVHFHFHVRTEGKERVWSSESSIPGQCCLLLGILSRCCWRAPKLSSLAEAWDPLTSDIFLGMFFSVQISISKSRLNSSNILFACNWSVTLRRNPTQVYQACTN